MASTATPAPGLRGIRVDGTGRVTTTWQAVRNEVLSRIRSNEWPAGQLIPTEKQLAAELGCARATVNRALRELADNGVLERRRKVGTRVAAAPTQQAARETSVIRNEIRNLGAEYGYRLVSFGRSPAPESAARSLHIARNDELIVAVALHLADDQPFCCETVWLSPGAVPTLAQDDLAQNSPQEWLAHEVKPNREQIAVVAEGIKAVCAAQLGLEPGSAVLVIERTAWLDQLAVSFHRQFYRPGHRLVPST